MTPRTSAGRFLKAALMQLLSWDEDAATNAINDIEDEAAQIGMRRTSGIQIDFEPSEALLALGAIQDKQLTSSRLAAISTGEEHEIADMSAKILRRVAQRLTDALYPDECRWMDNEDCRNPIEADGLCGRHLRHRARVAEILA